MIEIERSANILVMQQHNTTKLDPASYPRNLSRAARVGKGRGREYFIMSPHVVVDAFMIRGLSAVGRAWSCRPAARRRRGAVTLPQEREAA